VLRLNPANRSAAQPAIAASTLPAGSLILFPTPLGANTLRQELRRGGWLPWNHHGSPLSDLVVLQQLALGSLSRQLEVLAQNQPDHQRTGHAGGGQLPVGSILTQAGAAPSPGPEWLPCDGALHTVTAYGSLSRRLGHRFGGDELLNFGVPDLQPHGTPGRSQPPRRAAALRHWVLSESLAISLPIGTILPIATDLGLIGNQLQLIQSGWLPCRGERLAVLDPADQELFAVIGKGFGGSTLQFHLPDLRGMAWPGRDGNRLDFAIRFR